MNGSIVIDASCLLNLLASRYEVEIVRCLGIDLVAAPHIRDEARCLQGPPDDDGNPTREPADLSRLEAADLFKTYPVDGPVLDHFVLCSERLQDADAAAVAISATLEIPLASDDNRQRNVALDLFPEIELIATLEIFRMAVARLGFDRPKMRRVARDIRFRASFLPPKRDPDRDWFHDLLAEAD